MKVYLFLRFDRPKLIDIVELNIPTGIPLVYEFDKDLQPIRHYYLGIFSFELNSNRFLFS